MNGSGNNGGYALFNTAGTYLNKGDYHNVWIRQGKTFVEFVTIWLDLNQDGDFEDAEENIFTAVMPITPPLYKSSFTVPPSALLGITRMRVGMRWNSAPNVCGSTDFGEIEDYCVQIIPGTSITKLAEDIFDVVVFPNPFEKELTVQIDLKKETDLNLSIFSSAGQLVHQQDFGFQSSGKHQFLLQPNLASGVYFLKIQSKEGQVVKRIVR